MTIMCYYSFRGRQIFILNHYYCIRRRAAVATAAEVRESLAGGQRTCPPLFPFYHPPHPARRPNIPAATGRGHVSKVQVQIYVTQRVRIS